MVPCPLAPLAGYHRRVGWKAAAVSGWLLKRRMKLLLIRHAQSQNTRVAERVTAEDYDGGEALRMRWLADRISDPELTPLGHSEASTLARGLQLEYLVSVLDAAVSDSDSDSSTSAPVRCELVSSPMRAALSTAAPLSESLGCQIVVDPIWCELGGHGVTSPQALPRSSGRFKAQMSVCCQHQGPGMQGQG